MFDEPPDDDPHGPCAAEIHRLLAGIARALPAMREYARQNPKYDDQDPNGVHAWLDEFGP